jgi:hypothetical protein
MKYATLLSTTVVLLCRKIHLYIKTVQQMNSGNSKASRAKTKAGFIKEKFQLRCQSFSYYQQRTPK